MNTEAIARIRRFNRAVTLATGALDTSFLGLGRPLVAARVLWSTTAEGTDVTSIRENLRLDSGHLSRILRRLESEGMITTEPAPDDRRRRIARLTASGRAEVAEYDRLNDLMADGMLARSRDGAALLSAMDLIANTLNRDRIEIAPSDPEAPQAQACLAAYAALLAEKIPGFSATHVPVPDPEAASYRPPKGAFLLAKADGATLACVSLKTVAPGEGEVKRLWVAPSARGLGLARRMMTAIEDTARAMGLTRLRLDTNENLPEAIALYRATGWAEVAPFTGFPATHWFAKAL
ncbi:MAG: PadR family transcriptional regulator [Cereibacter sphaeroides]|uniref:PadR family transcriptional regulator n=1 Tax=Cereibacter sphaeroides TaxID=1063 RepID=A0A2W5US20_CERSP|nr:MAG: PadR family transcriptional regulator [Cereibacter sphaeroides]